MRCFVNLAPVENQRLMENLFRSPFFVLVASFLVMCLSTGIGLSLRKTQQTLDGDAHEDLNLIVAGTLTLLGLIIAFSFSMAISRYDQRKNYEEEEANAIGTEYDRVSLLPSGDVAKVRALLRDYLDQRVLFYRTRDEQKLEQINDCTSQLQAELWSAVETASEQAKSEPAPFLALAISGMNDVLNSQGYTQAAWWNRIPIGAWCLMIAVAIVSNMLVGYSLHRAKVRGLLLVLPILLCIALFLIADIDSPRQGVIRVHPQNLISLDESLHKLQNLASRVMR